MPRCNFSCQSERIFQSEEIIKSIEKNKDWSDYFELGYKKEIDRFNSSLDSIFKFRNEKINLLIKQQNLKDFATEELFFYNPIVDRMGYTVYIIEKDFAYGFSTEVL